MEGDAKGGVLSEGTNINMHILMAYASQAGRSRSTGTERWIWQVMGGVFYTYRGKKKSTLHASHDLTSREVHEARLPRTCSRPCAFEAKKTIKKNEIPPDNTKKTHHEIYPQQPGARDHLETACSETRPTR